ncbi:uncharacterized protein O3C94_013601 [Discoglossus pictus]
MPAKNGLECGSCHSPNTTECVPRYPMQCTGNENRCMRYTATVTEGNHISYETLYGCTTESICLSGDRSVSYSTSKVMEMDITCLNTTSSSRRIHYMQQISAHIISVISLLIILPFWSEALLF